MSQSETPKRYQRKRTKGYRLPVGVVCVTRPGPWGNPFDSAEPFEWWLRQLLLHGVKEIPDGNTTTPEQFNRMFWIANHIEELRGKCLACFCPLDAKCHADSLIRFANREV